MADKDNKSKLTYHVWDKDNNEYDIPDEVVQQRGMDNFAKDFEGGYITMFDDKKQKVDVPIEDVGEYRKQGYMWYDTSGNATPINEVGKKPSPSKEKEQSQYPQEVKRGELKKPSLISQALGMMPKVDAGNIGREQKMGGMITSMLLGGNEQQAQPMQQPQDNNQQVQQTAQGNASQEQKQEPAPSIPSVVNDNTLMDAKFANYLEDWKKRPDKEGNYFENFVADLEADGMNPDEALEATRSAQYRYANRSAMDVTNQVVSSLPDDTVQDAEQSIGAQWYSHDVQDKLKQEADSMGISYDDYVAKFLKPAMVQSLVNKYGPNYRNIAEGIATRLYSHEEHVQERLMNQDINDALSSVINKYVSPSVVDEYNKAQEAGSKAFTEGMEGSQFIPANLRLGTALGAQYEANEAKDPAKVLSGLQKKFGKLYRNPKFLNDMSNAAFKVMQRYGLNGTQSSDPKQFKPMINAAIKNELDQLEIKGMMPKGSAEYIMKTGLGNTIVGKIIRKAVQTDYQNWLEDIANQQYQPGFWENVASGALTFAGDAWSYWLPGAAGGKLTKSMVAKAEGRLAGDLMAKGMERKMAERAAKVLIGKSKAEALKSGAVHGAVTFGGQSAISKPIDEKYRTGQFDENGKIYNPSGWKIALDTLLEGGKQSALGVFMQGNTIANMIGKGRGLATNILADVGGKVVDSGIMTGHQILERMAQDPNFKPTGKDAAESFLESMANLTAIGLPGMVGKYARFKDAREFNKKYDFTDQDIAELKRFGYDGLRDAFEKVGIGEYAVVGENAQRLDGQLTQKYMDLMNDKSVPEVLKAKMMAVVEGKRPSSFSPVVDSVIVQPMDHDGKVYLETLNKDGGIIDRKEFSSLDEAQKADKKLEYEKTLGLASVLEGEFHNEFTQEHLEGLYNKAAQKYNMGEKLTDEDKAAVYLHQNAGAIKDIMDKQQKGIILTDEEQKQVNAYRHYYDSALENSSVMREFVNTFEDSHGVERGTLRKALESKDKKYSPLVESYLKELYNSIELKREMKQTMDDLYNTSHGNEQKRIEQSGIEGEKPAASIEGAAPIEGSASVEGSAGGQEPPVSEGPSPYQGNTDVSSGQGEGVSTANSDNSSADVITSDAFVMGQNAYKNGDSEALQAIDYNSDLATGRLQRAFADNEKMPDIVANAYNEGRDMEQFVAQRASSLTPAQKEAISKYVEAMDAKKGAIDALQHADDGYGEALKQQLWPYQTVDGNIVPATLDSGKQVFLKKANEYGGAFVVVPDEHGQPMIKQVSNAEIKEVGAPVSLDEYIENAVAQQKDARAQQFISQFDGSGLKPNDRVTVAMEEGDANIDMTFAGYSEDGKIVLTDGKDYLPLSKDEFAAWRKNALDNTINEHLDAEDDEREQKAVSQAEADKKQRYANGIVGLSEGQPDYSSKNTDPNVAAEYLQEQFGEDHGKLLNLVNGSRDDIKTQLANKKKAAAEYQNWLDTNADLDPEKAKKVEDELSLVNEQIADLDARFKNWNTIRNSVMTPDEVKAMKEERKAEIEKAGVDETAIVPSDDFHVLVLEDKELKKQYPTMAEATDYITSQRKDIYHTQEDVERKINGVNDMLEQYINGETELDPTQLMELNTTKAQLEALQTNLSVAAKGLKAQANKLSKLYKTEVRQQEMEELGMTPSEQRKVLVADALKKKDLKAIKEIYKDASTDVMDLTPRTLEEFVSERLFPHSLNAESLAQELGSSNFRRGIGSKYDTNKFNYLLAKKGEGLTINELAKRVWEDLSGTMESGAGDGLQSTYKDQDIRNTILGMFKTYDSVREMRNVTLLNRIAAAENELSGEEEWYEQQKEREIFEKQKEIDEYKSYIHDKELSLPSESELDYINGLEFDRMMEIEDREREYKQYVKSILPELADYDDRSNEEGYGGGSSLGSDSSRRGVDEGNSQGEEVGNGEASSESEIGEGSDSGRKGRQETGSMEPGEGSAVRGSHLPQEASFGERLKSAIAETETEPTEAQKKAGNYKKGHLSFGGYDYTVETPKGVTRSGKDEQGKPWSVTMHDTYGYILGKIGVDGDHIDMFINDSADLDTFDGNVYVVDQVNPETGEFDEHKVMYGYPSEEAATEAYLANYSKDWKGLGKVTSVPKATFDKWLESSDRKTKPFADYAMVQKEQAKFDRDVKEVEPSEMTEAQKVAYDAVSTMLKKAGIPVKVVSNEDMEKVAEAQDNLNLAMLLNQPEMRFKIKTPEEKQAAENAYNFAKELRPDKWKQYAVVNMSNPNKMPEYFEKQELARKERSYYNKLMWGNYKVFNLDKSFEDNVAGLTGSFPSEFDPYKIDEQTNKKNELKRQIKETEDAYNSTGQERNKYQIQLMKEYMDEHGLTSENDIPDDVWSDLNDKAHEKYQDKLDSLFAKYKDLDRQLKAVAEPGVRFLRTYHGSGASFSEFDFDHMGEGEGSQAFGWGGYVTSSKKIGKNYATLMDNDPSRAYYRIQHSNGTRFAKKYPTLESFLHGDKQIAMKDKFTEQEKIDFYNEMKKLAEPYHNLYEVDIPEDNGSNYLDWDASIPSSINKDNIIKDILDNIQKQEDEKEDWELESLENDINDSLEWANNGEELYKAISLYLGDKTASKLLASLGYTGIKYKAGRNFGGVEEGDTNYVIFKPEDMKIVDHTKFAQGKGVVYGYTDGKEIVLNQEHLNPNTPIHEYQHLWRTAAKNMNPELIEHGDKLIMQTQLFADLKKDPNYNHLTDEQICDEAFARLTGEDGAAILEQMAKDAIKENPLDTAKELSVINKLKEWLKKFWYWTLDTFTKWKPEDIKKMTLEDIRNLVLRDLAQGVDPRNVKSRMTKEDAVSLRKQMADNAEQERILEHTEENWLKEFGKDSRVTTPIGSIKLGENQYKKAGRNDRIKRFGLLKPTLERPDVIMEKSAPKEGAERQTKYLFIKSFKKADGNKILNYESITVKQGEEEVAISAHKIDPSKVLKELTESKVLWNRFRGDSNSLGENQGSALTPSANNPSGKDSVLNPHSDANIRNNIETTKGNGGNLSVEDKIKTVSQQFGVDEADVAMYANAVKKGSTAEAARARANIKRHLLQANEDNISSLKELLKYTVPVNNALKENFGDLDAMIEERVKQVEAQRNAMEAARKRAEEEEAKRQKHLEELSVIPDNQLDKQYMDALAKGDDATAREMLDEAARRKGYDDTESAYQGVGAWAAPGNPGYESDKARRDDWESSGSDVNLEDIALGYAPQPDDYFSHPERYSQNTPHGLESVKAINTAIDAIKNGEKDVKVKVYRAVPTSVKEGKLRNGDWVTPSKKYAEMHGTNRLEGKYRIIEDEVPATQLWWDGNDANEFGFDDGKAYKYKNAKNNRKLNDLVTYDDKGDVIPPSKRFNSRKSDVRFMFAGEKGAAEADKAEEQTIRMDNLDVAKQMEKAKKDAKIIKMATGWEKGVDGKWRYEMPDAKIKDTIDVGGGNIVKRFEEDMLWTDGKLEDAVDAPKLFEAYPQLKNIKIHTDVVMNDMPSNGEYNPQTKTITIHADELKYLNSILNHEIQHVIQREEGFAHGGTPEQVERDFNAAKAEWKARSYAFELEEKAKEMGDEYNQSEVEKALIQEYKDMDMPEFIPDKETRIKGFNYFARGYADRSMDDAIKRFRLDRFQRTDFDSYQEYRKLAGEVESRNVEKRLGMTDEERRNSLASETEDVNRDEQIVMNGNDASYSIVKDPETIKKLDKEDTVKVYRAMQVGEDGKLYPPMAAKVKGKFVEPIELGKWEQADERPELADDKGMFTLNKGNGKSLKAAYNPYLHTSRTPLNDQFSEAQNRPNIVTVEVEVPKSELTSGYKADKAKDAVGEVEWKAGIIQGQLTGKRKVVLSRWDKPVRIVPDSEVADVIVNDMFKGKNITMPSNVVTPSLRKELEKRGVPFVETDNRGRIVGGENDGVHYSKVYGKKANVKPRLGSATIGLKAAKDKVVELFNKAKSGEFNGKPQSIGTLTQEGKKFLEDLSGLKMKDKIDFVLNSSDLKHMNKDHFGDNEKDPGRNIPLTEEDLRSMVDVIMNPEQVVYGIEKMDNRKAFFFLKQAEDGTLNLAEIYSDKKGNLTAKSYYKTKKGVDQRVMEIKNSLLPTPEASSGSPLSDGKGINFFSIEQEKTAENERKIADSVVNTANKLGGAEATVYFSLDDVPEEYRSEVEQGAKGWYDPETHSVHVYLPNCEDGNDAQRTVFHEKIGHEGMEVLLGGEDGVRKFANFVYRSASKDVRGKIIDFANKYDPDWKNPDRMNVGTQEYIAHLAEEGPKTAEDFSLWTKIKHYLIKVLKKLGVRVPGLLNDKDLRYYLMKAGKALHVWDNMPKEKQEAMMKQASNAEIKDALSDGAGKGKPRQKKGESTIQYMKRVQEWRKWQNAREDKEDPEPPMFYDFDKDEAGKKEWAQLNKDWRERHHLVGEEPTGMPIRMENEEDDAYMTRIHEYEKWQTAMKDQEDPMLDMFAFEKKKQEEVKRKYEDWLTRHELNEQNNADLDLYEGKIYSEQDLMNGRFLHPAETNPKADALEQQVMQDLAEVTSTDVSKEGAAKTVKHAVIHRRKNMEEASADDAIYINDVKNRIEKMADSGAFDKLLSDYKGKPNRAEKLAEAIPYIIEAPRRLRDLAHDLNATGAFEKGHIHIQPTDVEAIQPFVADLIAETAKMHTVLKDDKEVKVYDDPQAVSEVANKLAQAINANHQGEEGFVPIDGTDILSKHVLPLVKQQIVPVGIDYKNLSPEMKAAIDSIRYWYNYTYDWLKDNHTLKEDAGYNVDYVNHIWDKEKSDPEAYATFVENRQRTKSPNEKPRTISTLMEGIGLGLVPKTTDITKMMAYYSRSNIEAWANKTMLQEVSGLNVIERNEDGEIVSSDPLLSSVAPFNLEQYKYFEIPGVGPVWVYNVSPKQMKVKNPITGKEKVLYSESSSGDLFGVVFETYQSSPFWKAFDTAASSAKKLELGFSGFHAGALTEVYMVQNMAEFGPKKAMTNFMKYIFVDTMKNHQLPCFANPEDFQEAASHLVKFGATNDYAAADVQNMFDNMRDAMMKVQEKLKDGNKISGTVALATMPLKVATQMLSLINKGMDRALWDFLHDGLKLATYRMRADKTKERAKKKGWTEEELSRALDEDGQFVNDMFGGQHWDILGASHRTLRYAGRVLLSPDWNASTTRHFLALTGFGSIWNEATFENFKQYYQRLWNKELTPEDEGRRSRQISALLCYGIGFMVFYEGIANGINAAFRALDEEKERKKAEEIRKTNPSYKSMYELAYGDEGMKWYDYLMRGNSLGQQSKIFMGRYADGTEMYIRHGKQFREVPEYLFNHKGELEFPGPMVQRMIGKANPMVRMTLDDINYLSDFQASHADQEIQRKYGKTIGLLYKDALYWAPFLIPSQENKEFKAVDFFFPSSKGFSPWKAQSYFKDFILSGDMEGVVMTYQSCQRNGIDPEAQIKAAIGSVKALESAEMSDGVTSLQEASKRFDAAKSITEKKKMRQKMKKFLSQSEYKAFTQKEALDMVQGYLNGDEDLKEMEKAESKYLMKAKAEDVTEDWRIQNVWNGTMETYQEYQRLKDVDKAKANVFKNSKTNKRLFAARKAISAARRKMNKAKKQMDGTNDAAKLVEIRNTRKELLKTLNGME
jgi:hypothetical protein